MTAQADGTVIINTEIKKDGAIDDIGSLKEALSELTAAVKDLTTGLANSFSGAGKQASAAAKQIDNIAESAREAETSVQSLEEQMAQITVQHFEGGNNIPDDGVRRDIYGRDVDAIIAKEKELEEAARQTAGAIEQEFQEAERGPSMLNNAISIVKQTISDIPVIAQMAGEKIRNGFASGEAEVISISDKVDILKERIYALEKQGLYFGDNEYDRTYGNLKRAEIELAKYKSELKGADKEQRKVTNSGKKMNSEMRSTKKAADPLSKSIFKLSNMFKFMLIRMGMRAVIQSAKDGFENLARYSGDANKAISSLLSAMTMLKNSFAVAVAPIVEVVSPILSSFIAKLAEVNNWIGQTMAALAGKDTFVKAVAVQEDYAASLSDTQKAAKEAAKEVKKAAFAFDTLIQAQKAGDSDTYKGPTPEQMFETIKVENEAKALAEDIKSTLSNLFQPLKASWDQYGASTVSAVKTMFGSLKQLAKDVGASFMQVWKDEGYGKAITDDLLITISNLALTVANLANQFDKAWINANTGTSIMRHLGDIVLLVTGFFRQASESIKNWSATLDFSPLLIAFDGVLASLIPVVSVIGSALLWLLNNVLLPLTKWAIEKALPVGLDLVSAALKVLNSVIDALKPLALWLWEEFLKPFGEWAGEVIIDALKKVTEKLKEFSDWIDKHKDEVALMTEYVLAFFAAWKVAEFVGKITTMISKMGGLGGALLTLASKLDIAQLSFLGVVAAAAALVAGALEVYKNWDKMTPTEKVISMLLLAAGAAATLAVATNAVRGPAFAALTAGAIVAGIAAAMIAVNAGKRSSATSASSGGGARSYATAYSSAPYAAYSANMPRLATGTVVPPKAGEFAAILGDNNKDYEVVSPLETMKQAFKEAIGEMGGIGGGSVQADMIIDGTKFGQLVYKYNNNEKQRVGVRMVTTGG